MRTAEQEHICDTHICDIFKNMVLILGVLDHAINLHFFKPTYTSKWYVIFTFQFHLVDFCGVMKMNCHVSNWITHQSAQEMMIMKIHGVTMTGVNFRKLQFNSLNRNQSEIIPNPIFKQFLVCGIVDSWYEGSEWYLIDPKLSREILRFVFL